MIPRKIIYFDLDGVLADWDKRKAEGYDPNVPGFYLALEPVREAVDLYPRLCQHHEVLLASTAPWSTPWAWSEKRLWVEKFLGNNSFKSLVLTHHKELLIGDYLIDDRTKNGAWDFAGKLILLGSKEFPGWVEVENYFVSSGLLKSATS